MIRIRTGSRLHFGVFSLPVSDVAPAPWPNVDGEPVVPARQFGGVGLMVQEPGVQLRAEPASQWSAEGPLANRALAFARQFLRTLPPQDAGRQPYRLVIEQCPPEHIGLGTGTQLGLAVARALADVYGLGQLDAVELARRIDRGRRSALGIHGFAYGGFLVEAGKRAHDEIAPLVARVEFPQSWRILLIMPSSDRGMHGVNEVEAFARLDKLRSSDSQTDALCRLVLLGMLPALAEADLQAFGETLYDFNRRVGELFRPVQGGIYARPQSAEIVTYLRQQGIHGVGQSSWGPTLFAVVDDGERIESERSRLGQRFALAEAQLVISTATDDGAHLTASPAC